MQMRGKAEPRRLLAAGKRTLFEWPGEPRRFASFMFNGIVHFAKPLKGAPRGFTLFTALVGFILLVLALLLVQSMISTEQSVSDVISNISSEEDMQAIADLSRADSLQVFNYGVRKTIEFHSTRDEDKDGLPENEYYLTGEVAGDWKKLKEDFVKSRFGIKPGEKTNQFAILVATHLIALLQTTNDTRGYHIEVANPSQDTMARIMRKAFDKQAGVDLDDFFEVIKCEPGTGHYRECVGSFYVTLDLRRESMSDEDYESLPSVDVEEIRAGGRSLKEPILPRGKFRVYVPLRLFKALAGAKELSYSGGDGFFDDAFYDGMPQKRSEAESFARAKLEALISSRGMKQDIDGFHLKESRVMAISTPGNEDEPEKIVRVIALLYFEDKNEKYIVNTLPKYGASKGASNIYAVRLTKTFYT